MFRRIKFIGANYRVIGIAWNNQISFGDLPCPRKKLTDGCFYFTEAGWKKYGHIALSSAARAVKDSCGEYKIPLAKVVVEKVKEKPSKSRVIYRDKWQVYLGEGK